MDAFHQIVTDRKTLDVRRFSLPGGQFEREELTLTYRALEFLEQLGKTPFSHWSRQLPRFSDFVDNLPNIVDPKKLDSDQTAKFVEGILRVALGTLSGISSERLSLASARQVRSAWAFVSESLTALASITEVGDIGVGFMGALRSLSYNQEALFQELSKAPLALKDEFMAQLASLDGIGPDQRVRILGACIDPRRQILKVVSKVLGADEASCFGTARPEEALLQIARAFDCATDVVDLVFGSLQGLG